MSARRWTGDLSRRWDSSTLGDPLDILIPLVSSCVTLSAVSHYVIHWKNEVRNSSAASSCLSYCHEICNDKLEIIYRLTPEAAADTTRADFSEQAGGASIINWTKSVNCRHKLHWSWKLLVSPESLPRQSDTKREAFCFDTQAAVIPSATIWATHTPFTPLTTLNHGSHS